MRSWSSALGLPVTFLPEVLSLVPLSALVAIRLGLVHLLLSACVAIMQFFLRKQTRADVQDQAESLREQTKEPARLTHGEEATGRLNADLEERTKYIP